MECENNLLRLSAGDLTQKNTTRKQIPSNITMGRPASDTKRREGKAKKAPRNVATRPQVRKGSEYLQELIDAYLVPEEVLAAAEDASDAQERGGEATSEGNISSSSSAGTGLEIDCCKNHKVGKHQTDQCKRKRRGINCVHGFCFQCCLDTPIEPNSTYTYCAGHYPQKIKKECEDRYIEEGLNRKIRDRSKFFSYEERFTDTQQTVTVWCSSDFYAYRSNCSDAMAEVAKGERRQEARKRRLHCLHGDNASSSTGAGTGAEAEAGRGGGSGIAELTTARGAENHVNSALAKAWCVIRETADQQRRACWTKQQQRWLAEQEKLGVQSTSWILQGNRGAGGAANSSPAKKLPHTPNARSSGSSSATGSKSALSLSHAAPSHVISPKRSRQ